MISEMGYRHIVIDESLLPLISEQEGLLEAIEKFSKIGLITIRGRPGDFLSLVERSGGKVLPAPMSVDAQSVVNRIRERVDDGLDVESQLGVLPRDARRHVLYLKAATRPVLVDLPASVYGLPFHRYQHQMDCGLRLVYHAMETCPQACIYCFANYDWRQPTVVLLDAHRQLEVDLNTPKIQQLVGKGYPIHLGSITDLASREALFFGLLDKALDKLNHVGARAFIGTKSPLLAQDRVLDSLRPHVDSVVVAFSFTNLVGLEPNLPYNASKFPIRAIRKLRQAGLRVTVLYRPVIPSLNDHPDLVKATVRAASEAGVEQIGMGFLKLSWRIESSIESLNPIAFTHFQRMNTERIGDSLYPDLAYRQKTAERFRRICDRHQIDFFLLCQSHLGDLRSKLETGSCVCQQGYWAKHMYGRRDAYE